MSLAKASAWSWFQLSLAKASAWSWFQLQPDSLELSKAMFFLAAVI